MEDISNIKITTKQETAIMGLALSSLATPKASTAIDEISFLFRGIARIEQKTNKQYQTVYKEISDGDPSLSDEEVIREFRKNKKILSRILQDRSARSTYCQCIILHISKWMKAVIKKNHDTINSYSTKKYSFKIYEDRLLKIGPKIKNGTWATAMLVASNYVRHFEEWDYDILQKAGPNPKDIKIRSKGFLKSLKGKKARKNVQALIDVGVKEADLFSSINLGPIAIMEVIGSDQKKLLLKNCEEWLGSVESYTANIVNAE